MDAKLLKQLSVITQEEKRLLQGETLNRFLYTGHHAFIVDAQRMIAKGRLVSVRPHTRFVDFPAHSHNYVEMIYMCQGQTHHTIGSEEITVKQGEILLLNQHISHAIKKAGQNDIAINILALPAFFDYAMQMIGYKNALGNFLLSALQNRESDLGYLYFRVADILPVQNLVENLVWGVLHKKEASTANKATMGLLMLELLHFVDRLEKGNTQKGHVLVAEALREVQDNYRAASLGAIAKRNKVSSAYVSALVKQQTGKTFKKHLLEQRLAKAADMLLHTHLSTGDIMQTIGYENSSYFYRVFKETFGESPKSYRKRGTGEAPLI